MKLSIKTLQSRNEIRKQNKSCKVAREQHLEWQIYMLKTQ